MAGYAIDAMHIAFSHKQGSDVDRNLAASKLGQEIAAAPETLPRQLANLIGQNKDFTKAVGKTPRDFFCVAILFLHIKSELQLGADYIYRTYKTLDGMLARVEDNLLPDDLATFNKVLFLVGLTLGYRGVAGLMR